MANASIAWVTPGRLCLLLASSLAVSGCHAPSAVPRSAFHYRAGLAPSEYFPLALGTLWSYDVVDPSGPAGNRLLLVNKVIAREGNRAVFFEQPDPMSYEDRGDRIVRLPSGTTVIQSPIAKGTRWDLPGGGSASIVAVDGVADTAHAHYRDCLVVEESDLVRRVVTTYAPGVGPVKVEIYSRDPSGEILASRALLQSFQPAGSHGAADGDSTEVP